MAPRRTRGRTKRRCWPGWRRRLCRGPWRLGLSEALAFVAWATRPRRASHPSTRLSCAGERLRSACGPRRAGRATGSARACVPLCAAPAGAGGAAQRDRRGAGAAAAPASVARWDDGRRVRPRRVSGAAGGARAATADQSRSCTTACWGLGRRGESEIVRRADIGRGWRDRRGRRTGAAGRRG